MTDSGRQIPNVASANLFRSPDSRKPTISEFGTFIRFLNSENKEIVVNSYASCRRLLDHMKKRVGIDQDEIIDVMDEDGKLYELQSHADDYANIFLKARGIYYVFKIELDNVTGEKRYTPQFNLEQVEGKSYTMITNALNALNKSTAKTKRGVPTGRQNSITGSSNSTPQSKNKKTANRKYN